MAPAASSLRTSAPSRAAFGPSRLIFEPARVGRPLMSNRFLTAKGTPTSGPRCRPESISAARFLARSARTSVKALIRGLAGLDARQRRLDHGTGLGLAAHHGAGDFATRSPAWKEDRSWPEHRRRRQLVVELDLEQRPGDHQRTLDSSRCTLARYSGAIGRPIALAASSTRRAMSGFCSATVFSFQAERQATCRAGRVGRKSGCRDRKGKPRAKARAHVAADFAAPLVYNHSHDRASRSWRPRAAQRLPRRHARRAAR